MTETTHPRITGSASTGIDMFFLPAHYPTAMGLTFAGGTVGSRQADGLWGWKPKHMDPQDRHFLSFSSDKH